MKIFNIVLVAIFTFITTGVFAQNNNNRSKKEQMKMEVVKMNTTPAKISNNVATINRSGKEQMKIDLMKSNNIEQPHELVIDKSGNCTNQLTYSNLSSKEQMKVKVMNQNNCMVAGDIAFIKDGKCTKCGKNAIIAKK